MALDGKNQPERRSTGRAGQRGLDSRDSQARDLQAGDPQTLQGKKNTSGQRGSRRARRQSAARVLAPPESRSLFGKRRDQSTPLNSRRRRRLRSPQQTALTAVSENPVEQLATARSATTRSATTRSTATRSASTRSSSTRSSTVPPKASRRQRGRRRQPARSRPVISPLLYVMRLLIVGVGIGVIAGTVLSSIDPTIQQAAQPSTVAIATATAQKPTPTGLQLRQELSELKNRLQALMANAQGLTPGVLVVDLDTDNYVDLGSSRRFAAASTIKLPILVALFEQIDAGQISLNEPLTMTPEVVAAEAGEMQFQPPGTQYSVLETATEMIRISDNTATNMVVQRLGGATQLNQRFRAWGLEQTAFNNFLPDVEGTNTISPKDLVTLLGRINQGEIVSLRSRDRILEILRTTETNDLLPQGLGPGAIIAHKTGNIGKSVGDVGLVDMPSGKRYVIMAMVERPHGDVRADELIRQISSTTYQFLESMGSTSEKMPLPPVKRSNIAEETPRLAPSMMSTDPLLKDP